MREREGPAAQPWEGEGEIRNLPTHAQLLERARWMRQNPTEAERRIWTTVRDKRLTNYKFKRQQIIFPYIVDFVCFDRRLIIEADGSQHADNKYDQRRDAFLRREGFELLRFWNNDILGNDAGVFDAIHFALLNPSPSHRFAAGPSLSLKGRGVLRSTNA